MGLFKLIGVLFKVLYYGAAVVLAFGVLLTSWEILSEKRAGRFLAAAAVGAVITLLLESWLHGGAWWMIIVFCISFLSVADPDYSSGGSDREDDTGLDAGDKFLLTLWIASLFEKHDR